MTALYTDKYVGQCVKDHGFTLPTTEMQNFAVSAINNLIVSTNITEFTFETSTDPIGGMGEFVISQKRRTHNEVERDVLFDAVNELQTRTLELEVLLQDANTKTAALEEDSFDKDAMLTVSLILSCLSFVMCLGLLACQMTGGSKA